MNPRKLDGFTNLPLPLDMQKRALARLVNRRVWNHQPIQRQAIRDFLYLIPDRVRAIDEHQQ